MTINSEKCKECPSETCTGKKLNRLGWSVIKCPKKKAQLTLKLNNK